MVMENGDAQWSGCRHHVFCCQSCAHTSTCSFEGLLVKDPSDSDLAVHLCHHCTLHNQDRDSLWEKQKRGLVLVCLTGCLNEVLLCIAEH